MPSDQNTPFQFDYDPSVTDVCREFNLSRATVYRLLAEGTLTAFKFGSATRLHRESVNALRGEAVTYCDSYLKNRSPNRTAA